MRSDDFFKLIVKPTIEEFITSQIDIRFGLLSAIVLNQMTDYWALEKGKDPKNVRKGLSETNHNFSFVNDVADATKHAQLTNKSRQVNDINQIDRTPSLFGAPFGEGYFAEACEIFAKLEDGTNKPLLPAVKSVLKMWEEIITESLPG